MAKNEPFLTRRENPEQALRLEQSGEILRILKSQCVGHCPDRQIGSDKQIPGFFNQIRVYMVLRIHSCFFFQQITEVIRRNVQFFRQRFHTGKTRPGFFARPEPGVKFTFKLGQQTAVRTFSGNKLPVVVASAIIQQQLQIGHNECLTVVICVFRYFTAQSGHTVAQIAFFLVRQVKRLIGGIREKAVSAGDEAFPAERGHSDPRCFSKQPWLYFIWLMIILSKARSPRKTRIHTIALAISPTR